MTDMDLLQMSHSRYGEDDRFERTYRLGETETPFGELLVSMSLSLASGHKMIEVTTTPKSRVEEIAEAIGVSEDSADEVVPIQVHATDDPDVFPFAYERGRPY